MSTAAEHHRSLIEQFYGAFQGRDGEAMAALYHPDVRFSDPVFQDLRGDRAGNMWRMLLSRAKDLDVQVSRIQADDEVGSAHWEARYTYSGGRAVHNRIDAGFRFADGRIVEHTDRFDLWAWSRMALGLPGVLLGWTPMLQGKIRARALGGLEAWESQQAGATPG